MTVNPRRELRRVDLVLDPGHLSTLSPLHKPLGVGDAGGGVVHHRRPKSLAQFKGHPDELLGLLGIAGFHHGHLGHAGEEARVLLVHRAVHIGIVGHQHHEPGVDARIGQGHEGIRGHVEPHVFHGHHRAQATQRRPHSLVEGHFLVDRPLSADLVALGQVLQHLCAGRARIACCKDHPGLPGSPGDGRVAGHQFQRHLILLKASAQGS